MCGHAGRDAVQARAAYDDLLPVLLQAGTVLQFKVCVSMTPHLRGHVYAQLATAAEAAAAADRVRGATYCGKEVCVVLAHVPSWKKALCREFVAGGECSRSARCPHVHAFPDPYGVRVGAYVAHAQRPTRTHATLARRRTLQAQTKTSPAVSSRSSPWP